MGINSYRAVGQILKRNPNPHGTPGYRVVNSNGKVGGYFGKKTSEKARKLREEGIQIINGKIDLKKYLYAF